jgi:hypothetical protein
VTRNLPLRRGGPRFDAVRVSARLHLSHRPCRMGALGSPPLGGFARSLASFTADFSVESPRPLPGKRRSDALD